MRKFSILLVFVYVTIFSLYNFVIAANPALPIVPGDNIQDPGDPLTAWGGCGPDDSNCYVTVSSEISGLDAASATNTINNAAYAQEWQWNTLAGGSGLKLSSTSTLATGDTQKLFEVSLSGANDVPTETTYAGHFSNTHTGATSTNVGLYATASGGTTNYAIESDGAILLDAMEIKNIGTRSIVIGDPNSDNIATDSFLFGYQVGGEDDPFFGSSSNVNYLGYQAGYSMGGSVNDSNFLGYRAGYIALSTSSNFLGNSAGYTAQDSSNSNFFGYEAGYDIDSSQNSNLLGYQAGHNGDNSPNSNFFGYQAGYSTNASIGSNFFGYQAGYDGSADYSNFFGYQAGYGDTSANHAIFIGYRAGYSDTISNTNNEFSILLGPDTSTGGFSNSIAMGRGATNTAENQLVFGSDDASSSIGTVFFGSGVTATSPVGVVINGSGASGTDIAGASLTLAGGKATGNAIGGALIFQTSDAGSIGATLQSLTTKATLLASGNFGVGVTAPSTILHGVASTANTITAQDVLTIGVNSTGVVGSSFGTGILFQGESSTTENRDMVNLQALWTTATDASRASALVYKDVTAGGSLTERFRFTPAGMTVASSFTIGNSSSSVVIGGSSGVVSLFSTNSASGAIQINPAGQNGGVTMGSNSLTQQTLSRETLRMYDTYTASSDSGTYTAIAIDNTFDLTGTASGIQRGIHLNPVLTSLTSASYRSIDIQADHANAYGIYQSGASTQNYFAGEVGISNTAPAVALHVGSSSTTDATTLLRLEDANSTCNFTADAGAPTCGSDRRLKTDIEDLDTGDILEKLVSLDTVSYHWKTDDTDAPLQYGFIAQNVQEQFPNLVKEGEWIDGSQKLFLSMGGLMPYAVASIKEINLKLKDITDFENEDDNSFVNKLRDWFASSTNGIKSLFVKDEICIGDGETCITQEDLKILKVLIEKEKASNPNNQGNNVVENNNQEDDTTIPEDLPAQAGESDENIDENPAVEEETEDVIIEELEEEVVTEEDVDLPVETGENTETVAEPEIIN
ncbi:MAG: tail fiber domain-containing protein [Candidatus Pacebacteria bacterium]|nr:tail fiber domain-containing protein [Candidatus Paceibacterota bacterium]